MTKPSKALRLSTCDNPDHAYVHCNGKDHASHTWEAYGRSPCWTRLATTFAQPPGRHRPVVYCTPECARHVNRHYMRANGVLVLPEHPEYETPVGIDDREAAGTLTATTRSYRKAAGQVAKAAEAAGIPKGSLVRTAMLTETTATPRGMVRLDGRRNERKVTDGLSASQSNGVGVASAQAREGSAEFGSSGDDNAIARHERFGIRDESDDEREQSAVREALGALPFGLVAEMAVKSAMSNPFVMDLLAAKSQDRDLADLLRGRRKRSSGTFGDGEVIRSSGHNARFRISSSRRPRTSPTAAPHAPHPSSRGPAFSTRPMTPGEASGTSRRTGDTQMDNYTEAKAIIDRDWPASLYPGMNAALTGELASQHAGSVPIRATSPAPAQGATASEESANEESAEDYQTRIENMSVKDLMAGIANGTINPNAGNFDPAQAAQRGFEVPAESDADFVPQAEWAAGLVDRVAKAPRKPSGRER